jgi:unsaturated rhamnogalacturonyl hydrolase
MKTLIKKYFNFLHKKYPIIILLSLFFISVIFFSDTALAQIESKTKVVLKTIANAVIDNATFDFVDKITGENLKSINNSTAVSNLQLGSRYNDWRYWNGVLNIAMLRLGEILNDSAYIQFTSKNIAFSFDNYKYFEKNYNGEGKWNYPFGQRFILEELDDCGAMGASVIEIYKSDSQERYKNYIEVSADHILNKQSRLEDGTLVRSFPYKWTIWADDLYMGITFLARMGELTKENKYFDDAATQVINVHKYLFDDKKQLMHHCWYSDVNQTGVAFWGRANGWALLAQIDLLDRLPKDYPLRDSLINLLQQHILGIARYQSGNGLWHQLLDKDDSYLETSCSAMFTYTIARAVNKGYIDKRYSSIAEKGWEGILTKIQSDGQIAGICTGTAVSDNLVDYYNRPAPLNDVHGIGTVLLAGSEILLLKNH